jgi:hypothetical protein
LSLSVFANEVQEKQKASTPDQSPSVVKIALIQENSPDTHLATQIVNSPPIPQVSDEKPSEFTTALSVYLLIIIVYSIYGLKVNAKNIRN